MLDRAKIQADVLVPLLRAFREELGVERANRIAWKGLEKWRSDFIRELGKSVPGEGSNTERFLGSVQAMMPHIGDAIDYKWLQGESALDGKINERIEFDITGCRFAQLFRALGEPELGFALLCAGDNTLTDEVGKGDIEFKRTQTIMQGGDHCDFRFALKKKGLV
jgi:L-2-amino-thiazoline-4-carboxylic acid hydrolase